MEACLIITYRCNAKCHMCNTWRHPSPGSREVSPATIDKIPAGLKFINITGGEPFLREDLADIVAVATRKAARVVISTNGFFTDRITALAEKTGNRAGFRVSLEGLPAANDHLRGLKNGFDHGLRTLISLHGMGIKDIGFAVTVSDRNAGDLLELFRLAEAMRLEFATATTHNSYYFHKNDNAFDDPEVIAAEFEKVAFQLLRSSHPKKWFRAYFNMGLANKVRGGKRPLPCEAGSDVFFLDPFSNVMPCNGSDEPIVMGNLLEQSFADLWNGEKARAVRNRVKECPRNCWMIGSASPAMKKKIWVPMAWILRQKLKLLKNRNSHICLDRVV